MGNRSAECTSDCRDASHIVIIDNDLHGSDHITSLSGIIEDTGLPNPMLKETLSNIDSTTDRLFSSSTCLVNKTGRLERKRSIPNTSWAGIVRQSEGQYACKLPRLGVFRHHPVMGLSES